MLTLHIQQQKFLSWLILAAVLLRALIPVGMMPGGMISGKSVDNRLFPLVICTSYGSATIMVGADKTPDAPRLPDHAPHEQAVKMAPCAFAGFFSLGTPVLSAFIFSDIFGFLTATFLPADILPSGIVYKSYLAQAPPLS